MPDGGVVEAPFDITCGACRSPWLQEIDRYLAEGLVFQTIRRLLEGRSPKCPNDEILRRHIRHLPSHQRDMRMQLEDPNRTLVDASSAVDEVVQLGYRQLASGEMQLSSTDWMRALALQAKIAKDSAAISSNEQWQSAFMAFFETVRRYIPQEKWPEFQRACMLNPDIRAVSSIGALAS
jgi:hypothetical protein